MNQLKNQQQFHHQQTNMTPQKCRACMMSVNEISNMQYLFENNNSEMFHQCSSIEINFSDQLPKYVCIDCHQQIIKFIGFRQTCIQSDLFYKQTLLIKVEELNVKEERTQKSQNPQILLENINNIKEDTSKSSSDYQNDYSEEYLLNTFVETCDNSALDDDDDHLDLENDENDENDEKEMNENKNELDKKEFSCDKCSIIFFNANQFESHLLEHTKPTKKIKVTKKVGNKSKQKAKSYKFKLINERFACTVDNCDKSYVERKGLNKHIRNVHENKNKSNKNFESTELLKSKEPTENFECDYCGKVCHKRHRIIGHLRQHLGLKPFICEVCGVEFRKYGSFRLHNQMKHSPVEYSKFVCQVPGCNRSYNLNQSLKVHHARIHLNIKKPRDQKLICETCGKSFKTQFDLKEHLYRHLNESDYPFPCELCPKKFVSKYRFKIHMMRHNNIRNFVCPICAMRKTTQTELKVHIKFHNKEKLFECKLCPAKFSHTNNITRHIRIVHHGYKPYKCTFCAETFSKSETLKHHTMRHTGEKPHVCTICDKRFIQAIALKTHLKTHNKPAK